MFEQQPSADKLDSELDKADSDFRKAEQKRIPEHPERGYTKTVVNGETIRKQRPALERLRLDTLAGLEGLKDLIGVSESAKALKEIERLEKKISEIQEEEPESEQ